MNAIFDCSIERWTLSIMLMDAFAAQTLSSFCITGSVTSCVRTGMYQIAKGMGLNGQRQEPSSVRIWPFSHLRLLQVKTDRKNHYRYKHKCNASRQKTKVNQGIFIPTQTLIGTLILLRQDRTLSYRIC